MTPPGATDAAGRLGAERYVCLTTFRRDGTPVPTAVWIVPGPTGRVRVWTSPTTGKAKRLRLHPAGAPVTLAPSDRSGTPTGPSVAGTAVLLHGPAEREVAAALQRKYGLLARLLVTLTRLRRSPRVGIEITC